RLLPEALFHRQIPLLDVLRRRVRVEGGKAHRRLAEDGRGEIKAEERGGEVIALPRLGENVRDVVPLVAPRVHIYRRVEDAVSGAHDEAPGRNVLRDAEPRGEVEFSRVHQTFGVAELAADEDRGLAILESKVAVSVAEVAERAHVFITESHLNGRRAGELEAVLREGVGVPLPQLHLRDARLALLDGWQAEQEGGQCRPGAVVGGRLRGEPGGELIIAAVLEEAPHRPDVAPVAAAELQVVRPALPAQRVAP